MAIRDDSYKERQEILALVELHKREQIAFETNYYEEAKITQEFRKNTQKV